MTIMTKACTKIGTRNHTFLLITEVLQQIFVLMEKP